MSPLESNPPAQIVADVPKPLTILQISDLHFGLGFQWDRLKTLTSWIERFSPAGIIVSGDFTMRARAHQFRDARKFLLSLNEPLIAIPGNHDVPLYNVPLRLFDPFRNYRHYVGDHFPTTLLLPGVSIYGMNTVNPMRHQEGIVRPKDLAAAERWLGEQPVDAWKIIVVHQHFADVPGHHRPGRIPDGEPVLERLGRAGAHMVVCGHTHFPHAAPATDFFPNLAPPLALVFAGTATSVRTRGPGKANTFNLIEADAERLVIKHCDYDTKSGDFDVIRQVPFPRSFYHAS